jgi:hypothetical protein
MTGAAQRGDTTFVTLAQRSGRRGSYYAALTVVCFSWQRKSLQLYGRSGR